MIITIIHLCKQYTTPVPMYSIIILLLQHPLIIIHRINPIVRDYYTRFGFLCGFLSCACLPLVPSGAACEQLSLLSAPPYAGRESEAVAGVDMADQTPSPDPCSSPTEGERGRE